MHTYTNPALLQQRISNARETQAQRQERERRSMEVASQMLRNGCCSNTVARYTGLTEAKLREVRY